MKCKCKMAVAFLLVLALLVPLSFGCGGAGKGVKTIHIGELTDFTGTAAPALKNITYVTEDVARYYNDNNLIPGVRVKVDAYDTMFQPAREITGYDWCKSRGAKVIITIISATAEVVKAFADKDKIAIAAMSTAPALFEPQPGMAFGFSGTTVATMKTIMQWVRQNDWKGQGTPTLGLVSWDDRSSLDAKKAVEDYIDAHPGSYNLVGGYVSPVGTSTFVSEAKKLKDCDYVTSTSGYPLGFFLRDLRAAGSKAKLFEGTGAMMSYRAFYANLCGWDALDGSLCTANSYYWNDSSAQVDLFKKLVHDYHPSEVNTIIAGGNGYVGAGQMVVEIFEILRQAIQKVGADNFDGPAFVDAAINYKTTGAMWKGSPPGTPDIPEWGFSQTKRILITDMLVYEFRKDGQDIFRKTDWIPMVEE